MGINKEMFECLEEMFFEEMKKHPKKDAIPIEWIRNYIEKQKKGLRLHDDFNDLDEIWGIIGIETLIDEWEEENGRKEQ